MKRTSPPAGVQARPVATPGRETRSSTSSYSKRGEPRYWITCSGVTVTGTGDRNAGTGDPVPGHLFRRYGHRLRAALREPARRLPRHRGDLPLEIPDAGLAGVTADQQPD